MERGNSVQQRCGARILAPISWPRPWLPHSPGSPWAWWTAAVGVAGWCDSSSHPNGQRPLDRSGSPRGKPSQASISAPVNAVPSRTEAVLIPWRHLQSPATIRDFWYLGLPHPGRRSRRFGLRSSACQVQPRKNCFQTSHPKFWPRYRPTPEGATLRKKTLTGLSTSIARQDARLRSGPS